MYEHIYLIYMSGNRKLEAKTQLKVEGILGFMKKKVTKFGTGAKVDCPKEYLGKTVYLVVCED
ncbi:MAG: DUF2080 family transposase-associated protein [Candidatus Thermoplasmatota archaeon]|nr:DUF2080 family transposase-associated protein [Candidatus Thermoplasmatota archaeon]